MAPGADLNANFKSAILFETVLQSTLGCRYGRGLMLSHNTKRRALSFVRIAVQCLLVGLGACVRGPQIVRPLSRPGYVGPVEIESIAPHVANAYKIKFRGGVFLLAVSPLMEMENHGALKCVWSGSELKSYFYDPPGERFEPIADTARVERVFRVDANFAITLADAGEISPRNRIQTFHVAYVCSHDDLAAFALSYGEEAFGGGSGRLLVLRKTGKGWDALGSRVTWVE